jgi:hypothetical protein
VREFIVLSQSHRGARGIGAQREWHARGVRPTRTRGRDKYQPEQNPPPHCSEGHAR